MNVVLLSGGSGKRLWPLSNDVRSKQFIKIFKNEDGTYESMLQRTYRQIKKVDKNARVTIATSKIQVSAIRNQLGEEVGVSVEPCRKDTFPAIVLASAYLTDVEGVSDDEAVVICPVDPYVEEDYFQTVYEMSEMASKGEADLVLLGVEPDRPSERYGYIVPETDDDISYVSVFKEKPDAGEAEEYIARGALWNGGVFAYRLKYVLEKAHELIDFTDYADLLDKYGSLQKISFDYAVVENDLKGADHKQNEKTPAGAESKTVNAHSCRIQVRRFSGKWQDLGTWNSLTRAMGENVIGKGILDEECSSVHIVNEMNVPVLAMGLHDVIISASPDGILVSDKDSSRRISPFVDGIEQQIMFAEKSWGSYKVMDVEPESITIKVTLNEGNSMNYHSHRNRDEVWVVLSGEGRTIVDGMEQMVSAGDVITMSAGCRHTVIATTELKLIEVQLGREINVNDKQKYRLEY